MLSLFRPLLERLQALFAVSAAQELEADLLLRDAERRADLLRQADRYDSEGLRGIATQLRQQAETVNAQRPLATVLPALEHLTGNTLEAQRTPLLPVVSSNGACAASCPSLPLTRKKGGKS